MQLLSYLVVVVFAHGCASLSLVTLSFHGVRQRFRPHHTVPLLTHAAPLPTASPLRMARQRDVVPKTLTDCQVVVHKSGRFELLRDSHGNLYQLERYLDTTAASALTSACAPGETRRRRRRQATTDTERRVDGANVQVEAEETRVAIDRLINITSGQSTLRIVEQAVRVRVDAAASDVLVVPAESYTNISVEQPLVQVNVSAGESLEMSADHSVIHVSTNRTAEEANIEMASGASNISVRSGLALVDALLADASNITIHTWHGNFSPEFLVINSNFTATAPRKRYLGILLLTRSAHVEVNLSSAFIRVHYGNIELEIAKSDHKISVFTDVYEVTVATLTSPYSILISDDVQIEVEKTSVNINPVTSDVRGVVPTASLMEIRPDNNTAVQLATDNQDDASMLAMDANTEIDVSSSLLRLDVKPAEAKIFAESTDSRTVVSTRQTDVGIRADLANIEIAALKPRIRVLSGNTTIEIGPVESSNRSHNSSGNGNPGHGSGTTHNSQNGNPTTTSNGGQALTTTTHNSPSSTTTAVLATTATAATTTVSTTTEPTTSTASSTTLVLTIPSTTPSSTSTTTTVPVTTTTIPTTTSTTTRTTTSTTTAKTTSTTTAKTTSTTTPTTTSTTTPTTTSTTTPTTTSTTTPGTTSATTPTTTTVPPTTVSKTQTTPATTSATAVTTVSLAASSESSETTDNVSGRQSTESVGTSATSPTTALDSTTDTQAGSTTVATTTTVEQSTTSNTESSTPSILTTTTSQIVAEISSETTEKTGASAATTASSLSTELILKTDGEVMATAGTNASLTSTTSGATVTTVPGLSTTTRPNSIGATASTLTSEAESSETTGTTGGTGAPQTGAASTTTATPTTLASTTSPTRSSSQVSVTNNALSTSGTAVTGNTAATPVSSQATTKASSLSTASSSETLAESSPSAPTTSDSLLAETTESEHGSESPTTNSVSTLTTSTSKTVATTGVIASSTTTVTATTISLPPESSSASTGRASSTTAATESTVAVTETDMAETSANDTTESAEATESAETNSTETSEDVTTKSTTTSKEPANDFVTIYSEIAAVQLPNDSALSGSSTTTDDFIIGQFTPSTSPADFVFGQFTTTTPTVSPDVAEPTAAFPTPADLFSLVGRAARLRAPSPPTDDALLSVGVRVDAAERTQDARFVDRLSNGLLDAYERATARQTGARRRRKRRSSLFEPRRSTHGKNVTLHPTSIDRETTTAANFRFFLSSNGKLILADKAAESFAELSDEELSVLITYPVVESVRPVTGKVEPSDADGSLTTGAVVALLVVILVLLLLLSIVSVACCKLKHAQVRVAKDILRCYTRPNSVSPLMAPSLMRNSTARISHSSIAESSIVDSPPPPDDQDILDQASPANYDDKEHLPIINEAFMADTPADDSTAMTASAKLLEMLDVARLQPASAAIEPTPVYSPESRRAWQPETDEAQRWRATAKGRERRLAARRLVDAAFPLAGVRVDRLHSDAFKPTP